MKTVYDDYRIIKDVGRRNSNRYYLVKCEVCGHEKECSLTNLKKQDNHHSKYNCKADYYAEFIGKAYGDYIVADIYHSDSKFLASVRCTVCGHIVKDMLVADALRLRYHSAVACREDYYNDIIGRTYGDLEIIEHAGYRESQRQHLFLCECTKCGMRSVESLLTLRRDPKHGMRCFKLVPDSPYKATVARRYNNMVQRCTNPNNSNYKHYGAKGVKLLYESPMDLYKDFYDDLVEHSKKHGLRDSTFDRIDVNGNYERDNLRIATQSVQSTNTRRKRVFILCKGNERVLSDSSAAAGKYIGSSSSAVGNVVRGESKTCNGWRLYKIIPTNADLDEVSRCESVTTKLIVT